MSKSTTFRSKKVVTPLRRAAKAVKTLPRKTPSAVLVQATRGLKPSGADDLFRRIVSILEHARARVVRAVNSEMVLAYWHIGREIVEHLQRGAIRADYGDQLLESVSGQLSRRFGRGFSATNLKYFRLFYLAFTDREPRIRHKACDVSDATCRIRHKAGDVSADLVNAVKPQANLEGFSDCLSWSHYRTLIKVAPVAARRFYEIEAEREGWSVPHLERQIHTHLFARLLRSRNKAGVMDLATRGQVIERPADVLRNPYVLDFLDLPESHVLRESDLESAILEKLQHFLLELGKGFAFVARQKRIDFDGEHFYVDLVFYNCILKCYLLVDLKLGRLTHQDVGQMDSYVRLFDDQCTTDGDGPTIGLILCAEKNEAVARYSVLHASKQLFAAKYVTYLPSVDELQREIERERKLIEAHLEPPPADPRVAHTRGRKR
jgi:predicted nuclease of restriction endonuclease-like (RecB) superfamily